MSEYNDLIRKVHRLADEFGVATEKQHQEQLLQEFVNVADQVVVHNDCPASYRTWLEKKIPEFKLLLEGLKAASEVRDLAKLTPEELNDLKTEGYIGWHQWVTAQPDIYPDFEEWLQANGRASDDDAASAYLDELEAEANEELYMPAESTAVMDQINRYKRVMATLQEQRYGNC